MLYIAGGCCALLSLYCGFPRLCLFLTLVTGIRWLLTWLKGVSYTGTVRLEGKVAVVTGANAGIGRAIATDLARRGAKVILACRDQARAEAARVVIIREAGVAPEMVTFMKLDLASFKSVRSFASELTKTVPKLDILVNNAGVAFLSSAVMTEDGQEMVFQVNHLGNFLLTNLLAGLLAPGGRVVMVSSLAHDWPRRGIQYEDLTWQRTPFSMVEAYGQSKLANILFAKEFGRRFADQGITTYSVHPGAVITELGRDFKQKLPGFLVPVTDYLASLVLKTPEEGAQTIIYCSVEPSVARETGLYYAECAEKIPSPLALSQGEAAWLWRVSEEIVGDI